MGAEHHTHFTLVSDHKQHTRCTHSAGAYVWCETNFTHRQCNHPNAVLIQPLSIAASSPRDEVATKPKSGNETILTHVPGCAFYEHLTPLRTRQVQQCDTVRCVCSRVLRSSNHLVGKIVAQAPHRAITAFQHNVQFFAVMVEAKATVTSQVLRTKNASPPSPNNPLSALLFR